MNLEGRGGILRLCEGKVGSIVIDELAIVRLVKLLLRKSAIWRKKNSCDGRFAE